MRRFKDPPRQRLETSYAVREQQNKLVSNNEGGFKKTTLVISITTKIMETKDKQSMNEWALALRILLKVFQSILT